MTTKEFEKQTLDQLLIDLKDIDNYKSFRKGVFVYDLGHYQGQLLTNEIERLNNIIDEAKEYIRSEYTITDDDVYLALYSSDGTLDKLESILKGDNK